MAKQTPATPRVLLAIVAGIITSLIVIYAVCMGWTAWPLFIFYVFSVIYVILICRSLSAICYTVAGSVCAVCILMSVKYLDEIAALFVSIVTMYMVAFVADMIVSTQKKHVPSREMIDFSKQQLARSALEVETVVESMDSPSKKKAARVMPLSRKEKKAEKKRERRKLSFQHD